MPLVTVHLTEGRTPEQLRAMMGAVSKAVQDTTGTPQESIRVIVNQVPPQLWLAGAETLAERAARG